MTTYARSRGRPLPGKTEMTDLRVEKGTASLRLKMADRTDPNLQHDVGQVGDIVAIDPSVVKALQDDQFIPVISPIGFGERNESYNINADLVAAKLATVLKAEKLVMLTNIRGVLDKRGELLVDAAAARGSAGAVSGGGSGPMPSEARDAGNGGKMGATDFDGAFIAAAQRPRPAIHLEK